MKDITKDITKFVLEQTRNALPQGSRKFRNIIFWEQDSIFIGARIRNLMFSKHQNEVWPSLIFEDPRITKVYADVTGRHPKPMEYPTYEARLHQMLNYDDVEKTPGCHFNGVWLLGDNPRFPARLEEIVKLIETYIPIFRERYATGEYVHNWKFVPINENRDLDIKIAIFHYLNGNKIELNNSIERLALYKIDKTEKFRNYFMARI